MNIKTIVKIFKSAGNDFVNSILEKRLKDRMVKDDSWLWNADDDEPVLSPDLASPRRSVIQMTRKPNPNDPLRVKEDFIRAKYVGKSFMDSRDIEKVMGDSAPQEYFWRSLFSPLFSPSPLLTSKPKLFPSFPPPSPPLVRLSHAARIV